MKRNFLSLTAIAVAIAACSFTMPTKAKGLGSGEYWFSISNNIAAGAAVPEADATFIQQSITAPTETCASGTVHQCVSGFDQSQVNTSSDQLNGTQTPETQSQLKN